MSTYVQELWLDQTVGTCATAGPNSLKSCQTAFQINWVILHTHLGYINLPVVPNPYIFLVFMVKFNQPRASTCMQTYMPISVVQLHVSMPMHTTHIYTHACAHVTHIYMQKFSYIFRIVSKFCYFLPRPPCITRLLVLFSQSSFDGTRSAEIL